MKKKSLFRYTAKIVLKIPKPEKNSFQPAIDLLSRLPKINKKKKATTKTQQSLHHIIHYYCMTLRIDKKSTKIKKVYEA